MRIQKYNTTRTNGLALLSRRRLLIAASAIALLPIVKLNAKALLKTDRNIAYQIYGEGNITIVFVHGWSCDSSYWSEQLDFFSKHYRVVTIDLGGHGASNVLRQNYTIESFGDDVLSVVNTLDIDNIILVGHSMGGPVVVDAAGKLGTRVKAVIGVDTLKTVDAEPMSNEAAKNAWTPFQSDFRNSIETFVRNSFFIESSPPELVSKISIDMANADSEIALSAGAGLFTFNTPDAVRNIANIPLTLINAPEDPTNIEALEKIHGNYNVIIIPNTGHFVMMEKPNIFNETLKAEIERYAIK